MAKFVYSMKTKESIMSNTPHLTQFQQKAQMRLQEMDVEWRRTLFERFREICREEVLDVMKSLLTTMKSPEALALKLEEMSLASRTAQDGLHEMLEQTCQEVRRMAEQMKTGAPASLLPLVDTKALEEMALDSRNRQENLFALATRQQENATMQIKEDLRESGNASRRTIIRTTSILTLAIFLICATALFVLNRLGTTLLTAADMTAIETRKAEAAALDAKVQMLMGEKSKQEKEYMRLMVDRETLQVELRKTSEMQRAATASLADLQQTLTKLQALEEQFRFKLVKGENGGVFVEIPAEAKPFQHEEATFIQVK